MTTQMLSVREAADTYHIGRNRLYDAIRTGELRAYRPNSRSFVLNTTDIEAWIESYPYSPIQIGGIKK